jgi:hypothetical protein
MRLSRPASVANFWRTALVQVITALQTRLNHTPCSLVCVRPMSFSSGSMPGRIGTSFDLTPVTSLWFT